MAGYTPVFDSIFTGTLCGKYPDTAAWMFLLALADKNGVVDMTTQYIATVTGMPAETLMDCIGRFMQPDPHSRSSAEEGRRLILLNTERNWGWKIVNHAAYREKARLMGKAEKERESGANSQRMKDRRRPPETAADPLSDSYADTDTDKTKNPSASATPTRKAVLLIERAGDPLWLIEFRCAYPKRAGDQGWRKAVRAAHARVSEGHTPAEFIAGARRYAEFCEATGKAGTEFVKQACTFLGPDKPFLLPWHAPPKPENATERILRHLNGTDNSRVIEHEPDEQTYLPSY